ncbi:hypothetical protein I5M27_00815 [Adhaeribacter sp. BT258]|uniref:Outer membrane protein beta-barrel domain-containing protein n=1 Tax=Adhaeribacter terrigena TaxID=2793070 RepID=A0ABS1BWI5_9BACT|nr:hypothetical protein [Adhaeribacter terrigena]MBK0401502.1 hypothetical protein [Adhaeribacter terrigena]
MKTEIPKALTNFSKLIPLLLVSLFTGSEVYSQETEYKKSSIRTAIGIGINEGSREIGMGLIYSIGWQKSVGEKNKLRINPNMTIGGFLPIAITDTRDQFYRITSLGINIHYDLIKYKAVSIVATGGGFINYSRGLLGTGGWRDAQNNNSEYFYALYYGGNASVGLRIDPKQSRFAYEVRPINIHLGNKGFILGYLMVGIDFKLKK